MKQVADDALLKFTQDGKFLLQIGRSNQSRGNADTANVHRSADGWVYPKTNELFVADGKYLKQIYRADSPFARNLALSPDREQQFLYVGADKGIAVVDRKAFEVIGTIQVPGQVGPGHHIAADAKGNIYIAQTSAGMQKLVFKGVGPGR